MIGAYANIYYDRELLKQVPTDATGSIKGFC